MLVREEVLSAIPGNHPGGRDLRQDSTSTVYAEIEQARQEDDLLPQGEWVDQRKTADFAKVRKLAEDVLATQSKDLQVAVWLVEALARLEGFPGLHEGMDIIRRLLEDSWDHLYPELEDGDAEFRATPLNWLGSKLGPTIDGMALNAKGHTLAQYRDARALGYEADAKGDAAKDWKNAVENEGKVPPEDFDQGVADTPKSWYKTLKADLQRCRHTLQQLKTLGTDKFAGDAPSYLPLEGSLGEFENVALRLLNEKLEVEPDEEGADDEQTATGDATDASSPAAGNPISVTPTDVKDAASRIAAAARFLQRDDPQNPASYLMLRGFRWGELRAGGSTLDPKLLSAPPDAVRTKLKQLSLDQQWGELLVAGEGVMATPHGRGWLDLQMYVLKACGALGNGYDNVSSAIRSALAGLLRDFPTLPRLELMDGYPTANAETRGMLRDLIASQNTTGLTVVDVDGDESVEIPATAPQSNRATSYDHAMSMVRAGQAKEGIDLLLTLADQEKSPRESFLRKLEAASIMVDTGHEPVALPMLRELEKKLEDHSLEGWEAGETVARPLGLLYRCLHATGDGADAAQKLYLRICRLDPLLAIELREAPKTAPEPAAPPAESASPPDGADDG